MADDEYQKKLGEMQRYVPFLENTIKRLKSEKAKPREAQISKLQSLLIILTDSKKKLKLDALRKCEEVILKLYDKVEKKPVTSEPIIKYMCRTPPGEKPLKEHYEAAENDLAFNVARQKLKQADLTPASPSPPLDHIKNTTPVVIPTEKQIIEPFIPYIDLYNKQIPTNQFTNVWSNIPQTINWPKPVETSLQQQQPIYQQTDTNWKDQDLYKRRNQNKNDDKFKIWDRNNQNLSKNKTTNREVINYSDAFPDSISNLESSPIPKVVPKQIPIILTQNTLKNNNRDLIKISFINKDENKESVKTAASLRKTLPLPPAPQSRKSLEKEILPLNKPPLSERDIQDLLSPVIESPPSEEQSSIVNEDMDLDKLEALKAKLCKELEENKKSEETKKPKDNKKDLKIKSPPPVVPKKEIKPKVIERVIKEQDNIFGSLLSSIDKQILDKSKDKKSDKKDIKKDDKKKDAKNILNVKDLSSINDKVKSIYLKEEIKKDTNDDTKDLNVIFKDDSKKSSKSKDSTSSKEDKESKNKDKSKRLSTSKEDKEDTSKKRSPSKDEEITTSSKKVSSKSKDDDNSSSKDDKIKSSNVDASKRRVSTSKDETKKPEISKDTETDSKEVSKTVENIMKNLKESITKPTGDPLSKFADLVKEKSDQLCSSINKDQEKPVDLPSTGRISDKYPHKRKSIDTRAPESPVDSNKSKLPQEMHPVKLIDPRLRNTKEPGLERQDSERHFEPNRLNEPNCIIEPNRINESALLPDPPLRVPNPGGHIDLVRHIEPGHHFEPVRRLEPGGHLLETPRHFEPVPGRHFDNGRNFSPGNPEFSFQNTFNNMNVPPNNLNRQNIFCNEPPIRPHPDFHLNQNAFLDDPMHPGSRTPCDPFLNSGPRGSVGPGDQFNISGPRPQNEPFINSGPRILPDPFINAGARTPVDPFLHAGSRTPVDPFLNTGNMTPGDQFLNPGNRTPGREPFHNFDTFPENFPNRPRPDSFPNNFNNLDSRGPDRFNQERFNPESNSPFWNRNNPNHPDHFNQFDRPEGRISDGSDHQQNRFPFNHNQRFANQQEQPNVNQYDLSQMNPIDFYDNEKNNRFDSDFQNQNNINGPSFRGRGCVRGNFGRGRGGVERNPFVWSNQNRRPPLLPDNFPLNTRDQPPCVRDPRENRNDIPRKIPLLPLPPRISPNTDNFKEREDNRRPKIPEIPREQQQRPKFNREDDHKNDNRTKPVDDRFNNRYNARTTTSSNREEKKPIEETPEKNIPQEKETPEGTLKPKDEISSPLDSLYSTETKKIGKGYGLQKFKIPKLKKPEDVKKELVKTPDSDTKPDVKPNEETEIPADKTEQSEEIKNDEPETVEEIKKESETSETKPTEEAKTESNSSKDEDPSTESKSEASEKLNMFNKFMKHIFETCDSSVLFQYLDNCGFALPKAKTKRIRRIIESDSSESEEETKDKEIEKPPSTPTPVETTPENKEPSNEKEENEVPEKPESEKTSSDVIETVGERIKNRRRKPVIYSSDSSPDKLSTQNNQQKEEIEEEAIEETPSETQEKPVTRKSRSRKPTQPVDKTTTDAKTPAKTRRKNALELLQEDIREMFISEGVLTATGKRMCRMMKEHQESGGIYSSNSETDSPEKKKEAEKTNTTESEDDQPLKKLMHKKKNKSPETPKVQPKRTRQSPRVVLEKLKISKKEESTELSTSENSEHESEAETPQEENKSTENSPKQQQLRRTRRSNPISSEFIQLDEKGEVSVVKEIRKTTPKKVKKSPLKPPEETIVTPQEEIKTKVEEPEQQTIEETNEEDKHPILKRKPRKKRGGWAAGVINKNKKKKTYLKNLDKNPTSPTLTISTEKSGTTEQSDQISLPDTSMEHNEADSDDKPDDSEIDKKTLSNKLKIGSDNEDEEYSLLQIDTNADVNYYLDNGNKFDCKLCDYKGKLIVHHYRLRHPESENMISRLSPEQASAAKIESKEFNFEKIIPYEESIKGKKRRTTFVCRFCLLTFKQEFTANFFDHICCHTGEYRYKCHSCSFSTGVKKTLSTHCHNLHPDMEKPIVIKPVYPAPPNFRLIFGYLCRACNFTQLLKPNLEKHIKVTHPNQDISIIKISMSTKPIPLTDLKPSEETTPEIPETTVESPKTRRQKSVTPVPESPRPKRKKSTPTPEPPQSKDKEPDLTVFMVPDAISEQEKLIESERLKKMEEVNSNVVPRRSKLQFVDKLKTKLDSVESEIALLESMEAENAVAISEMPEIEEIIPKEAVTPEKTPITPPTTTTTDNWISIASTCSLANTESSLFDSDLPQIEDLQDEPIPSLHMSSDDDSSLDADTLDPLENVDSSLQLDSKQKGVLETIHRLAAKLKNTINNSSATNDSDETEKLYYSPEITPRNSPEKLTPLKESPKESPKDPPKEDIILNGGAIQITQKNSEQKYTCLVPDCSYSTPYKISFTKHCSSQHLDVRVNCKICQETTGTIISLQLIGLFVHLLDFHKNGKTPPKITPIQIKEEPIDHSELIQIESKPKEQSTSKIRIRRISGDVLSSFPAVTTSSPTKNNDSILSVTNEPEYPTISIPEGVSEITDTFEEASSEPVGFLQISNVRTLTPEEENKLGNAKTPPKAASPAKHVINYAKYKIPASGLITKTVTNENKPSKTIIYKKNVTSPVLIGDANVKTTSADNSVPVSPLELMQTLEFEREIAMVAGKSQYSVTEEPFKIFRSNKSSYVYTLMLKYPKILEFYKCAVFGCTFSTNKRIKFEQHFKCHTMQALGLYCTYCFKYVNPDQILEHYEKLHGNCNIQCAFCFYRAQSPVYVVTHQKICHQITLQPKYYTVPPEKFLMESAAENENEILPRKDAILPFVCKLENCSGSFYTTNEFLIHLKIFHKKGIICSLCENSSRKFTTAEALIAHYSQHGIGSYQCRYCNYGHEDQANILVHYSKLHYNKKPIAYLREFKSEDLNIHIDDDSRLADIVEVSLETEIPKPANETLVETCPNASDSNQGSSSSIAIINQESDNLCEPEITLKHLNNVSISAIQNAIDPLNLDETPEFTENDSDVNIENSSTESEPEIFKHTFEDSGLKGSELFICGTSDCQFKAEDLKDFKDHLFSCNVITNDGGWYTCFHCKKRFKYVGGLIDHMMVHGPQRYHCSRCPAKSHLENLIIKHMKTKHQIPFVKLLPINDKKTNINTDNFFAVPNKTKKNKRKFKKLQKLMYQKELQNKIQSTKEQIKRISSISNAISAANAQENAELIVKLTDSSLTTDVSNKISKIDDKYTFGPEDIDRLPRPPVYSQEIKCKVCSYNTKVRSNMQKHLRAHIENKPVADIAPINPVPCLEKNELMFDKMTNLAASSHSGGRMGGKKDDKVKDKVSGKEKDGDYPNFIPVNKRYVCGADGCNYLTHGDSMLRHHLTALHLDELNYKCPHCQTELAKNGVDGLAIDNILFHLKMHDLHLYKCNNCEFYHYQKHKIERHIAAFHPTISKESFSIVRELDNSANLDDTRTAPVPIEKSDETNTPAQETAAKPWKCGFCSYRTTSRGDIQQHAASVHQIKSQYKCGLCHFRCSAKNNYNTHFKNKHPSEPVSIISVFYKSIEETANLSGSEEIPESIKTFDTTPLWSKNKTGIKHIRGILLEETSSAPKKPKIIEKLQEAKLNLENKLDVKDAAMPVAKKMKVSAKNVDTSHNIRFPANFGQNKNEFYVCPACNKFQTKTIKLFVNHLYKEINYFRFLCNFCSHKSIDLQGAEKHFKASHPTESISEIKQICTVLKCFVKAEKWVEKCLQIQKQGILQYENNTVNSSTETIILQMNNTSENSEFQNILEPDISINIKEENITTDKDDIPNLNDSNETIILTENTNQIAKIEELLPPVLESQVEKPKLIPSTNTVKCEYCPFTTKTEQFLKKHVKKHFEVKPYLCKLCPYKGTAYSHLQSHFNFKHPTEEIQYDLLPIPNEPTFKPVKQIVNLFVCLHCPRRSESLNTIREHFIESHEKLNTNKTLFRYKKITIDKLNKPKYSCQYCTWTSHLDGLKQHHLLRHSDKEYVYHKEIQFKCSRCDTSFDKLPLLRRHYTIAHPKMNLMYQCITKEFNDEHIETFEIVDEILNIKPDGISAFRCEYCSDTFTQLETLKSHHNILHSHLEFQVEEHKKYKCPKCQHTSNSYPAMRDHLRNHNKPYKCGYCDLTAAYPNIIKSHHVKEHHQLELEPLVTIIPEAQKLNEELRENLLIYQNGAYIKMKNNLKRTLTDTSNDEQPPTKKLALEIIKVETEEIKRPKKINVARKSTATPPKSNNVAKKSTTPRPNTTQNDGFTFYGTKPQKLEEIKHIMSELPIMGKNVPLNIGAMSQILNLFPIVPVININKNNT